MPSSTLLPAQVLTLPAFYHPSSPGLSLLASRCGSSLHRPSSSRRLAGTAASLSTTSSSSSLNPPASTRPPKLSVPNRDPSLPAYRYYLAIGKAYLDFYKAGLSAVLANRRLLRARLAQLPSGDRPSPPPVPLRAIPPPGFSRADWVLLWRSRRDTARLALFGAMLLVLGEFTPLVVRFVDGAVPGTCRIPRQVGATLERAERRRRNAFFDLEARKADGRTVDRAEARAHVLRSLDLTARLWDTTSMVPPWAWPIRGRARLAFLEGDDALLVAAPEGLSGLEAEELRIACADRGIEVLGKKEGELLGLLGDWLRLTSEGDVTERRRRRAVLLLTRPDKWPTDRDFELPDWEL